MVNVIFSLPDWKHGVVGFLASIRSRLVTDPIGDPRLWLTYLYVPR